MSTTMAALLISLTTAAPASAATPTPTPRGDLERLQGVWEAKSGPRGEIGVTLAVEGETIRVAIALPRGLTFEVEGEIRVDASQEPGRLDWVNLSLADGQELPDNLAIYRLDGERLTIRNGGPNHPRPSAFVAGEGPMGAVVTFTRRPAVASNTRP